MKYINTGRLDQSIMYLSTEQRNEASIGIDRMPVEEMLRIINNEDKSVPDKVAEAIPAIAEAIRMIVPRMREGGRMVYCAAGTSARIGFMDAAECPPTYYTEEDTVSCLMAGGRDCVFHAKEVMEDSEEDAKRDLIAFGLTSKDTVVAAAASGRTPYGVGALKYAKEIGAGRVCIACNKPSRLGEYAEVAIEMNTGAEVITGSTRMKAGTAQKLVMNMLSTGIMVQLGRTYDNLIIEGEATNSKGSNRHPRMFAEAIGNPDLDYACKRLDEANWCVRCALLKELTGCDQETAHWACTNCGGNVKVALRMVQEKGK